MRSLLNKNLSQFTIISIVLFLLCTPVFYFLTEHYYAEDLISLVNSIKKGESIPDEDLEIDVMEGVMIQYVVILGVLGTSLFIVFSYYNNKMWEPFYDTLRKIDKFNLSNSNIPVFKDTNIIEFQQLNNSLTKLMEQSKKSYLVQKEFTENASHELQTPIAIIKAELDLLLQENLTENQLASVSRLYDMSTRVGQLNKNLLMLAKIENSQYLQKEEVDLSEFIEELIPQYRVITNNHQLTLYDKQTFQKTINANRILLECLTNNLVINAVRHSRDNDSIINISIKDGELSVSNEAEGNALDLDSLLQRFNTNNKKKSGTGLGLSIVKAICDFHNWELNYKYIYNYHCFIVKIPN